MLKRGKWRLIAMIGPQNSYQALNFEYSNISNTLDPPWRWICSIEIRFPERVGFFSDDVPRDTVFGTGTLITRRHVLTSAHILRRFQFRSGKLQLHLPKQPSQITVIPGRNDDRMLNPAPFGRHKEARHFIPGSFRNSENSYKGAPHDYAIIELERPIGDMTFRRKKLGWWSSSYNSHIAPIDGASRTLLENRKVNVAGYPGDKDPGDMIRDTPAGYLYHDFDKVQDAFRRENGALVSLVTYDAYASPGQSGGPVWTKDKVTGHRYLVAVHRGKNPRGENEGVLITPQVIKQLDNWGVKREWLSIKTL
jgi:V8-like Glu-specific endopeptidase